PMTTAMANSHILRLGLAISLMAMTPPSMVNMAQIEEIRSHCLAGFVILGGATAMVAKTVTITMGTLIRKTEPHQKNSKSSPPMIGPAAAPATAVDIHSAIATLRSRASRNVIRTNARLAGIIVAAPMPKSPRAATKNQAVGENAAINEPVP